MRTRDTETDPGRKLHQAAHQLRLAALEIAEVGSLEHGSIVLIVDLLTRSMLAMAHALDALADELAATYKEESP